MLTKNIYLIKLAKCTDLKFAGIFEQGYTRGEYIDYWYVAKRVKKGGYSDDYGYKFISNNSKIFTFHDDVKQIGEYYITKEVLFATVLKGTSKRWMSRKNLLKLEKYLNKWLGESDERYTK